MSDSDELVSQFMAFTGCNDGERALSYLEMSGNQLETAVGLYMEHQGGGGGAVAGAGAASSTGGDAAMAAALASQDEIRAPDATRSMRLLDDHHHGPGPAAGMYPFAGLMNPMLEQQLANSAFSSGSAFASSASNVRDAVNAAAAMADDSADYDMEDVHYSDDDEEDNAAEEAPEETKDDENGPAAAPNLADMFAPPNHIITREGGFEGARTIAKDNKRWLLVNLQRDSEFSCHALNRDVWRDELVENLIREGFIFWQAMDITPDGKVYAERYKVHDYPHIALIDPRTRRLMWRKEGWTQVDPFTAQDFAELVMDFCSRNSFDKPPSAPKPNAKKKQRPMHEMSEQEQLQAAMQASLQGGGNGSAEDNAIDLYSDDENDGEADGSDDDKKMAAAGEATKEPSLLDELVSMPVGEEPASGARVQLRMPDGKRMVRKFVPSDSVKTVYAFVAQSSDEARGGRHFVLMAGFPPKDLMDDMDSSIEDCKLSGQAITVRWK